MASTNFTNSVTLTDADWFDDVDTKAYSYLTGVAGTNTITANGPVSLEAYAAGLVFEFIPANTNTAATTINITGASALGARNIFSNGAACVGGELRQNVPVQLIDDGTRFHILSNAVPVPFVDTYPVVVGSVDSTKKVRFEVDGLTTATTRVITVPDSNLTLIGTGANTFTGQQTLSGNAALNEARADIAMHATTMDLWAGPNVLNGTGSAVTMTDIVDAPQAGARRTLIPIVGTIIDDGAVFDVDGDADYTTLAGDRVEFEAVTVSTFKVHITKADGTAVVTATVADKLVKRYYAEYTTAAALSTAIPQDDTIPQNTEGTQILSIAIDALASATNRIRVIFTGMAETVGDDNVTAALFWDSVASALCATGLADNAAFAANTIGFVFEHVPGDTSTHTYNLRVGPTTTNVWMNAKNGARIYGGASRAVLMIEELTP